jgi:Anti-sigma-K factor rskA
MTPDFDELIGTEGTPEEREELRHVHELLLSASPPPRAANAPRRAPRRFWLPRRWAIATAATVSVAAGLAAGYVVGTNGGFQSEITRPMHGVGPATAASAVIRVADENASDNRPLLMDVRSLRPLNEGWYELYLTKKGKPVVPCGIFETGAGGTAHVTMNAPADLAEYDGWIVTAVVGGHRGPALLAT